MSDNAATNEAMNMQYTGERHIPDLLGVELMSMANLEHMIRYAFVAPFVQGKHVLDISCGSGYGTQYIALQGAAEVVGVDIDEPSLEYARRYHANPVVTYLQSDAHSVPELADQSFDVIVSFETIEHLKHPKDFLLELRRLLRPGGQLFISCPNDYRVSPWVSEFHLYKFRFEEFRDMVVNTFGEAQFLGQHHAIATCLVTPGGNPEKAYQFGAYRQENAKDFFAHNYVEHLSAIENADAYLGIVGVDQSAIQNSLSLSQQAFQALMGYCKGFIDREQALLHQKREQEQALQAAHETMNQTVQSQQVVIETLQEKLKLLEERYGRLLREGTGSSELESELANKQAQLDYIYTRMLAMETSKFWKLRKTWFKIKRRLNLPGDE